MKYFTVLFSLFIGLCLTAQEETLLLDKGLVVPRLPRNDVPTDYPGKIVYDTDTNDFLGYRGQPSGGWARLNGEDKQRRLVIPHTELRASYPGPLPSIISTYSYDNTSSVSTFHTGFSLPQGSKITSVSMVNFDNHLLLDLHARLFMTKTVTSQNSVFLGSINTSATSTDYNIVTNDSINSAGETTGTYDSYHFHLFCNDITDPTITPDIWPGNDIRFVKLIVEYEMP